MSIISYLGHYLLLAIELTVCSCANTTLYFENGSKARLVCPLVNDIISWTGPPDRHVIAVGEKTIKDGFRVTKNRSIFTLEIYEFTEKNTGIYTCESTITDYMFSTVILSRPAAPTNIQTVALTKEIIVKWSARNDDRLRQEFFIEYRTTVDITWQILSAGTKSTFIINNLEPDTVYIIRMYSKTVAGESNKTDEIILATDKRGSEGTFILAVIPGVLSLLFILFWFGIKGFKNRRSFNSNTQRINTPQVNDIMSVMPRAQYDEIDSLYYNPLNDTIARQAVIPDQQENRGNVAIIHSRISLNHHSNRQELDSDEDNSLNTFQCNLSGQSSSDDSYLVPCKIDIVPEEIVTDGLNENQGEQLAIDVDDLSVASESSETDAKSVQKYEKLLTVDTAEHSYQ